MTVDPTGMLYTLFILKCRVDSHFFQSKEYFWEFVLTATYAATYTSTYTATWAVKGILYTLSKYKVFLWLKKMTVDPTFENEQSIFSKVFFDWKKWLSTRHLRIFRGWGSPVQWRDRVYRWGSSLVESDTNTHTHTHTHTLPTSGLRDGVIEFAVSTRNVTRAHTHTHIHIHTHTHQHTYKYTYLLPGACAVAWPSLPLA